MSVLVTLLRLLLLIGISLMPFHQIGWAEVMTEESKLSSSSLQSFTLNEATVTQRSSTSFVAQYKPLFVLLFVLGYAPFAVLSFLGFPISKPRRSYFGRWQLEGG